MARDVEKKNSSGKGLSEVEKSRNGRDERKGNDVENALHGPRKAKRQTTAQSERQLTR
jgi:hypothetical protein